MKIVLFCENKYAIDILKPIHDEAVMEGGNDVLWYIHRKRIPSFPLDGEVVWTNSIQEIYDFGPEAIFVPGNIVPYYLPGVKIRAFWISDFLITISLLSKPRSLLRGTG